MLETPINLPLTTVGDDYITVEISSTRIQKNLQQVTDSIYRPDMVPVQVRRGDLEHIAIVSSQLNILRTICPNFPYLYASSKGLAVYENFETGKRLDYSELTETQQASVLFQTLSALNLAHHLVMFSQDLTVENLRIYRRPYTTIQILDSQLDSQVPTVDSYGMLYDAKNCGVYILETDVIAYIEPDQSAGVLFKRRYYTDLSYDTRRHPDLKQNVYTLLESTRLISPEKIDPITAIQNLRKKYPIPVSLKYTPESCFVEETSPHHLAFNQRTYTRLLNLYVNMPNTLTGKVLTTLFKHLPDRFSRLIYEFEKHISTTSDKHRDFDINNSYNKMKSHLEKITVKSLLRFIKDYSQVLYLYNRELSKNSPKTEDYTPYFRLVSELRHQILESEDQDLTDIYVARFEL